MVPGVITGYIRLLLTTLENPILSLFSVPTSFSFYLLVSLSGSQSLLVSGVVLGVVSEVLCPVCASWCQVGYIFAMIYSPTWLMFISGWLPAQVLWYQFGGCLGLTASPVQPSGPLQGSSIPGIFPLRDHFPRQGGFFSGLLPTLVLKVHWGLGLPSSKLVVIYTSLFSWV